MVRKVVKQGIVLLSKFLVQADKKALRNPPQVIYANRCIACKKLKCN